MTELLSWTLDTIRADSELTWLEERRFEWVPIVHNFAGHLLSGSAVFIITDKDRSWLEEYIVKSINRPVKNRPYLPFFSSKAMLPNIYLDTKQEVFSSYANMLDIVCNSYIFWYIGRHDNKLADFAKKKDDNFLWIFDEQRQNNFSLRSTDENLDLKLISLNKLLDKTIDAVMFGEVNL
jgi:hypothetical protein